MCLGGVLLWLAFLLGAGFVFVRTPVRDPFEPFPLGVPYPVEAWLLQAAVVLGASGVVLVFVARRSSPEWKPGARDGSDWPWFNTVSITVMGVSFVGASITAFVAAPASPNRTVVLVLGCIAGALFVIGSLFVAPTSEELERYRHPVDTPIEAVE